MPDHIGDDPGMTKPRGATALKVLVVDDDVAITELLCAALARRQLGTASAHSAEQARAEIDRDPDIAVVVSDIRMPGQTGLALAAELMRDRADGAAIEIILVTGGLTADDALGALRARAFDVINKPFRLAPTLEVVERALASVTDKRRRASREADLRDAMHLAETERHRLADRLAQSAARLAQTQSSLALAERARGDLFAVIHHELRTPLIPILGFSEIIAQSHGLAPDDVRSYADMIRQGANQLLGLIDSALDILALDQGQGLGDTSAQPVADLVEQAVAGLAPQAARAGVAIQTAPPGSPGPTILGDPRLLRQALDALIDNAIKASPPGLSVGVGWEAGVSARIWVRDHGPGVPTEVLDRLGTPFLQGDMSHSRPWPGAGLGLALTLRIAQAHGGRLDLGPRPGGGTEAALTLPLDPHQPPD